MSKKTRKPVLRMCISCREMIPKSDMIRVVRSSDGVLNIDMSGKMNGRGAYICQKEKCLENSKKSSALERSLEVEKNDKIYEMLEDIINRQP